MAIRVKKITQEELDVILEQHKLWLKTDCKQGKRADLSYIDLSYMNLSCKGLRGANLTGADLSYASLYGADLSYASLYGADLREAILKSADLREAILKSADLSYADLSYANLRYTSLYGANLEGAILIGAILTGAILTNTKYNSKTANLALACPEEGSFIGFKKAYNQGEEYIVKLLIPEDAKRSSATSRKCRCSKAKVLSITNLDGSEIDVKEAYSGHDSNFIYKVGEVVEVEDFDDNRWEECTSGIHFFITRDEAVRY